MVTVAVKVAVAPAQMVLPPEIVTVAAAGVFTIIEILLEVADVGEAQVALDVSTQVTASLFASDEVVYVVLLVPTLVPFTFH